MAPTRVTSGFSVLEIVVVVAIIGIAASIVIPSFVKHRDSVREAIARNDLRVLSEAVDRLALDSGKWPGGIPAGEVANPEVWDLSAGLAGIVATDGRFPKWNGPYVKRIPLDPWGSPYFFDPDYRITGVNYVVVGSFGPNGVGRNVYDSDNIYIVVR